MNLKRYTEDEKWLSRTESNSHGVLLPTIENFTLILENDPNIKNHIMFNELKNCYEYHSEGVTPRDWEDRDDARIMSYIENAYHVYNKEKYSRALSIVMEQHVYNPLKDIIEHEDWDGVDRIDSFLVDILKCDPDSNNKDYYREVSRMIFYGGIARLYKPGIKFDYMPILIGEQGVGKSTIIDWLALNTEYYKEITTIDGQDGIECLEGGWICEFAELLAMTRQKDVQSMKAFVTRTADRYRMPYHEHTSTLPRKCIFIGTTNDSEFLTDITGNRRYLPVEVHIGRGELFDNEDYVRDYILFCWREALYKMNNNVDFYLTIPNKYQKVVESMQERRVIEDPKLVELEGFLSDKEIGDKVCSRMLWAEAFRGIMKDATKGDFKMIGSYMNRFKNWKRFDSTITFEKYGKQKYWMKMED